MRASVIIPAYNAEATIAAAVDSCLAPTTTGVEVIVVDDGSTDGTRARVAEIVARDARVSLLALERNGGVARARNAGIAAARGRWIALLDADDAFEPSRLDLLTSRAEALDADLLADNLLACYPDGTERPAFPRDRMTIAEPMTAARFVALDRPRWGMAAAGFIQPLVRRAFLQETGLRYDDDIAAGEDFQLYVRCLLRGARLFFTPEMLYRCTIRDASLSRSNADRVGAAMLEANRRLRRDAERAGDRGALVELARREHDLASGLAFDAARRALRERRYRDAVALFVRHPSKAFVVARVAGAVRRRARLAVRRALERHAVV